MKKKVDFNDEEVKKLDFYLGDKIWKAEVLMRKLGLPRYRDGRIDIFSRLADKKSVESGLESAKGHGAEVLSALEACIGIQREIEAMVEVLHGRLRDLEDLALAYRNAIQPPYDSAAFHHAWAWQCRVRGCKSRDIPEAPDSWKEDYDKVMEIFRKVTEGLETHNVSTSFYASDASMSHIEFTVAGSPGDFEISFPLVGIEQVAASGIVNGYIPMMGLTWRRRWVIPVYDYFFDGFGTNDFGELHDRLLKFVRDAEWKKFYNMEGGKGRDGKWVTYSDEMRTNLKSRLNEEIDRCSREKEEKK